MDRADKKIRLFNEILLFVKSYNFQKVKNTLLNFDTQYKIINKK